MGEKYYGIYIYGDRTIFLLSCDYQGTEYESQEKKIGVAGQICTYKYQSPHKTMIYIPQNMGENVVVIIHIYEARAILLLFYDHQDTESESTNINTEK